MISVKEIGSEFWNVPVTTENTQVFPNSIRWFLSGRSALQAIIRELKGMKSVAMPAWCCDSMVKPFVDAGIQVDFYPCYIKNGLVQDLRYDSDALFVMDYFGYTSNIKIEHPCVIRDVTHSLFSKKYDDANYYFGSLRKWCGVWTGGYAWKNNGGLLNTSEEINDKYIKLRRNAMEMKADYIGGISESKDYLNVYEQAEDILENAQIAKADKRDIDIAMRLDIEFIKNRRRSNAEYLMNALSKYLIFNEMRDDDCPMFVPIIVPFGQRDALRKHLISKAIYCPVHWPLSKYHNVDPNTEFIYKNELSLVCDQRYTEKDMQRMVASIKEFLEGIENA